MQNNLAAVEAQGELLGPELSTLTGFPGIRFTAFLGEVTSSSLVTRTETVVVGKRSTTFNHLGVLFKGVDIKEAHDHTYQEMMIKRDGGGPQISVKCEETGFRASVGQRVAFVTAHTERDGLDMGMVNLSTGQKTWFVKQLFGAQKSVEKHQGFWGILCLILGTVVGGMFSSFWVGAIATIGIYVLIYTMTPFIKSLERQEAVGKAMIERIPKCLDALYEKFGAQ